MLKRLVMATSGYCLSVWDFGTESCSAASHVRCKEWDGHRCGAPRLSPCPSKKAASPRNLCASWTTALTQAALSDRQRTMHPRVYSDAYDNKDKDATANVHVLQRGSAILRSGVLLVLIQLNGADTTKTTTKEVDDRGDEEQCNKYLNGCRRMQFTSF